MSRQIGNKTKEKIISTIRNMTFYDIFVYDDACHKITMFMMSFMSTF
jgi:hypothetical protein